MIWASPPPLAQFTPTGCFDLLSFCRSAYIISSQIQRSALIFFTGKRYPWFASPCSCWLISHIGILFLGRGMMEGFILGVDMCTSVSVSICREGRPLLKKKKKPTHTAEFGSKRNYKDTVAVFFPVSQPQPPLFIIHGNGKVRLQSWGGGEVCVCGV